MDFMKLCLLSYKEFLMAAGQERFADLLDQEDFKMITAFRHTYIDALKNYYYVGRMPEAVLSFSEHSDYNEVRQIQKHIIEAYEQDFSKHAPNTEVPKIRQVWNSIPSQLAKENRKFVYGLIREGGRVKEYETVIMWLGDCGLVHRVSRVNAAGVPLKAYEDQKAFKLYMLDVGLQQKTLLDGDRLFAEFKGALTEQYACQQPETLDDASVYYYTNDRGSCEVDFVLSIGGKTVPLEVKDETNLKAKSLKTFREKDEPELSIRMSMADYREEDGLVDLPLYAAEEIKETVH